MADEPSEGARAGSAPVWRTLYDDGRWRVKDGRVETYIRADGDWLPWSVDRDDRIAAALAEGRRPDPALAVLELGEVKMEPKMQPRPDRNMEEARALEYGAKLQYEDALRSWQKALRTECEMEAALLTARATTKQRQEEADKASAEWRNAVRKAALAEAASTR